LLQFDLIGFQTERDRRNFVAALQRWLPGAQRPALGTFPISIDYAMLEAEAAEPAVSASAQQIQDSLSGVKIVLGVDRLDYTKGIPERLMAFQTLLEKEPHWRGRVSLIQIVVPSREDIPEYSQLRLRIERLVSQINGQYSRPGWFPVVYFHRCVSRSELLGYYRAAHVAVVTPLKDGMNLVAKEFCAARTDDRGVLVLSEFAGAAEELRNAALTVNPHDLEKTAASISTALHMSELEQKIRMNTLRRQVCTHDVFRWCQSFLDSGVDVSDAAALAIRG